MTAGIYNEKVFSRKVPMWHGSGIVGDGDKSALEVAEELRLPDIKKVPLIYDAGQTYNPTPFNALVRVDEDGEEVIGKPVGDNYVLITPYEAVKMFDIAVLDPATARPRPCETMGMLGKGERLFITTKIGKFSVKGDETETYLAFLNPNDGVNSATVMKTLVRIVCQNTYSLALATSVYKINVPHTKGAAERLQAELIRAYSGDMITVDKEKAEAEYLASKPFTSEQVRWVAGTQIYTVPKMPRESVITLTPFDQRMEKWEKARVEALSLQEEVTDLFNGRMIGYDSEAVRGTAFGALQAFAELETWRKARNARIATAGLFEGDRRDNLKMAYSGIMELVK